MNAESPKCLSFTESAFSAWRASVEEFLNNPGRAGLYQRMKVREAEKDASIERFWRASRAGLSSD